MRVSIVIPSYNQVEFLERTLSSVTEQPLADVEILVMDGGSTDGSVETIERYSDRIAFWRSERDDGQSGAIADGLARATGDILGWINSDDLLLPDALTRVVDAFARHRESEWLIGGSHVIDANDRILSKRMVIDRLSLADLLYGHYRLPQESVFYRAEFYRRIGGIRRDLHWAMDFELWVRMLAAAKPRILPAFLGAYRIQPNQKTAAMDKYQAEIAELADAYRARFWKENPALLHGHRVARLTLPARRFLAKVRAEGVLHSLQWMVERRSLNRA